MTRTTPELTAVREIIAARETAVSTGAATASENPALEQRLAAVDTLLADPEAIPDPLEVELYAYREQITEGAAGS